MLTEQAEDIMSPSIPPLIAAIVATRNPRFTMSPDDPDDLFRPPNDNAYETDEVRTGPPLDYVAEKLRHNLESLHSLIHEIQRRVPEDLSVGDPSAGPPVSVKEEYLLPTAHYGFRCAIVGYLALKNMLALANDNDLYERLLAYSRDEFKEWLDRIDQAGSVTG